MQIRWTPCTGPTCIPTMRILSKLGQDPLVEPFDTVSTRDASYHPSDWASIWWEAEQKQIICCPKCVEYIRSL